MGSRIVTLRPAGEVCWFRASPTQLRKEDIEAIAAAVPCDAAATFTWASHLSVVLDRCRENLAIQEIVGPAIRDELAIARGNRSESNALIQAASHLLAAERLLTGMSRDPSERFFQAAGSRGELRAREDVRLYARAATAAAETAQDKPPKQSRPKKLAERIAVEELAALWLAMTGTQAPRGKRKGGETGPFFRFAKAVLGLCGVSCTERDVARLLGGR